MKVVCVDKGHKQNHNITVGKTYDVSITNDYVLIDPITYNNQTIPCYIMFCDDNGKGGYRCEQFLFITLKEQRKAKLKKVLDESSR